MTLSGRFSAGPGIRGLAQHRSRLRTRVRGPPVGLVAVEVAGDLRGAGTDRADIVGELGDLPVRVQREPVAGHDVSEFRVGDEAECPMPLNVSRQSRTPTVCRPSQRSRSHRAMRCPAQNQSRQTSCCDLPPPRKPSFGQINDRHLIQTWSGTTPSLLVRCDQGVVKTPADALGAHRPSMLLEDAGAFGKRCGLGPVGYAKFAEDVGHVDAGRLPADE